MEGTSDALLKKAESAACGAVESSFHYRMEWWLIQKLELTGHHGQGRHKKKLKNTEMV